ncbi:MAG TPA: FixH family protein [Ignavibacteriaceae bacterium]|nr:FixH family protein [Ignavibacteriaceae bacterium]
MKKFNWGYGILIVFIVFILFALSNIIFFMNKDVELVANNYYEKGTDYQQQIKKISNSEALKSKIVIKQMDDNIEFIFPEVVKGKKVIGMITFYRPSNSKEDKYFSFNLDKRNDFIYNAKDLVKGMWRIKIDWQMDGQNYYSEETLFLN